MGKHGHTLSTLARKLELTVPSVWAWANGRSRPKEFYQGLLEKEIGLPRDAWRTERELRLLARADESGPLPEATAATGTDDA